MQILTPLRFSPYLRSCLMLSEGVVLVLRKRLSYSYPSRRTLLVASEIMYPDILLLSELLPGLIDSIASLKVG